MNDRRLSPSQAHRLDAPERRVWLPISDVLNALEIQAGWIVADIGAGTGYFALPAAEAVGNHGKVFAVDAEPEMLSHLQNKLASSSFENVECKVGEASSTGLLFNSCDLALLADIWHELDDTPGVLAELHRILKAQGRVAILDWRPDVQQPPGPPIEHRLTKVSVANTLTVGGFHVRSTMEIGSFTYLVVADSVGGGS